MDLVLLDFYMPEMYGEDLLKAYIREADKDLKRPYFILASGLEEVSDFVTEVSPTW